MKIKEKYMAKAIELENDIRMYTKALLDGEYADRSDLKDYIRAIHTLSFISSMNWYPAERVVEVLDPTNYI